MSTESEKVLKTKLEIALSSDFKIEGEVVGKTLVDSNPVRIDYMLFPKEHLVERGFAPIWFGVEVKSFEGEYHIGKMNHFIFQCISYSISEFKVKTSIGRPAFVLAFSDIPSPIQPEYWTKLMIFAGLSNIGTIELGRNWGLNQDWIIKGSSAYYFQKKKGNYIKHKFNILKRNYGNCS